MTEESATDAKTARSPLSEVVGKIAWEMRPDTGLISPGDRAELRRGRIGPAFWRVAIRHLERPGPLPDHRAPWRKEAEDRWMVILRGMAETAGLHRPGFAFGRAMVEAGVSEARLLRLLRASDESLHSVLRSVVHQLAAVGQPFGWENPAFLVLSEGKDAGENVRRQIARDYFIAQRSQDD